MRKGTTSALFDGPRRWAWARREKGRAAADQPPAGQGSDGQILLSLHLFVVDFFVVFQYGYFSSISRSLYRYRGTLLRSTLVRVRIV